MPVERARILLAEDDEDDYLLTRDALTEGSIEAELHWVQDGQALLEALREGLAGSTRLPDLVLLDLNMPRLDGRAVLAEMHADPHLRAIPVVVLTTSADPHDVDTCYDLGANSYVQKPESFEQFRSTLDQIVRYWCRIVTLPHAMPLAGRSP